MRKKIDYFAKIGVRECFLNKKNMLKVLLINRLKNFFNI